MLRRMTHYFTALIFLIASSVIYENVITPWMEPPTVTAVGPRIGSQSHGDDSLADLFPDGAWQRETCKRLQSSSGMLLFQSWKQISDDQWKLWPVTVVVGRGMSEDAREDPVIIEAAEGAEITFTESLDVMSGGAPPIHRGRMIGEVSIRRSSSDEKNQSLSIRTANVGIDSGKIWTTESIVMNFGEVRMVGRDLTIHFAGPTGAGGDAATALDRMELIYLDELVMPLENGGLTNSQQNEKAQVSLQCGGRLEYDFALDQLALQDSVSLIHQVGSHAADHFRCDSLLLKLRDPTNELIRRDSPLDWLVNVVASGSPARAVLPSFDAELIADEIELDAIVGLIRGNGKNGVRVRRGGIVASLAQLAYQFDPKVPEAMGAIDVQGAGIVTVDDPEIPILRAHWRDSFKLQPTGLATAKKIDSDFELWIDGDVQATLTDGGEFKADAIEGVLKPETTAATADEKATVSLAPERFQATGNVRIDTAALAAETQRLLLYFVDPIDAEPRPGESHDDTPSNPLRRWVMQPKQGESTVDPVARPRPIIRGDSITAQLTVDDRGVNARDLSVTGNVNLTHVLKAGGQMLPAKLTGQRLRLIDGGGQDVLQLGSGTAAPARFELGDGFFVGPLIQIRPSDNLVWINDAGEFQMPTAALPASLSSDPNSNIQWTSAPHCRWQGEMVFDGRSAVLTEGVEIKASLLEGSDAWDLQMQGDRLQVDLQQDVQVSDMQTMQNAVIQRVSLLQSSERPVIVQAWQRAGDGVLEAKHLIHAAKLTLTPGGNASGDDAVAIHAKLVGDGPGSYRGWMIPPAKNPLTAKTALTTTDDRQRRLSGIHLIFNDSMHGDLVSKSLEFLRGVRVGVRPVDSWEETFDAAAMDAISLGDSTLDCDRLKFTVTPSVHSRFSEIPAAWEMEANNGVVFRTRSERGLLEGTASRAAYSSGKNLFTVEGAPNRAAIFRQTLPNGKKGPEGAVKTMTLRPDTMEVQSMQLERLNIATPPSTAGNR